MAGSYVDFVESLIYGAELAPDPNHEDWLAANPAPDGLQWFKGAGEIHFDVLVRTEDNGGREERTRLPQNGHYSIGSGEFVEIGETVFEGFVEDDLAVGIRAMERDTFDHDDNLGSYVRTFSCSADDWIGGYGPGDERIDAEDVGHWRLFYRIERA